jgi:hypothetical protein
MHTREYPRKPVTIADHTKDSNFFLLKKWTIALSTKAPAAKVTDVTTSNDIQSPQGNTSNVITQYRMTFPFTFS